MSHKIRSTAFASYNYCPAQYKLQNELRVWGQNMDIGSLVHRVLANAPQMYYNGESWEKMLAAEMESVEHCTTAMVTRAHEAIRIGYDSVVQAIESGFTIETEVPLERVLPSGITITGTTDRIDDDGKTLRIIDYKTGSYLPTKQDMMGNLQLLIYSFLCQDKATLKHTIEIGLFSLGRGIMQTVTIPPDVEACIEDVLDVRAQQMVNDTEFKPNPSSLCKFCDYLHKCKFWEDLSNKLEIPKEIDEKVAILESVISVSKGLEGVVDALKEDIVAHMMANEIEELHIEGKDRRIVQTVSNRNGSVVVSKPYIRV